MIEYENALLLFSGWRDEGTPLICESTLYSVWKVGLRGTVESVSGDGMVNFLSADRSAFLVIDLSKCDGFEYGESTDSRIPLVVVSIPLRRGQPSAKRDKLLFSELRD